MVFGAKAACNTPRRLAEDERQHRLDGSPLAVDEFVADESKLRFGGMNHGRAGRLTAQTCRVGCRLLRKTGNLMLRLGFSALTLSGSPFPAAFVHGFAKRVGLTFVQVCRTCEGITR